VKKILFLALLSMAVLGTPEKAYSGELPNAQKLLADCEITIPVIRAEDLDTERAMHRMHCASVMDGIIEMKGFLS